ncbi:prolipoprotein diacylglyceryl transferase [Mesorhizobium sp.]|uniref:prolipoprotein diacylglyceryl transferase n=1 Tax=Mesorhizobium sp. TaxID=1871066 RepID=UPI0025FF4214|nr:prolipoprotein diacylglyceryl transferase [Mesorhizobium sp.]
MIDPVALTIGPLEIRWYGILFAGGIAVTWLLMRILAKSGRTSIGADHVDGVMFWITLAVICGGRAGDLLLYRPNDFFANPMGVLDIDQGGMSFFGGLIAVVIVVVLYARAQKLPLLGLADVTAASTPIGLGMGRVGNFMNGELFGPRTSLPWGIAVDPGAAASHPTQLYEAVLEGLVLLGMLYPAALWGRRLAFPGRTTGLFMSGYGFLRFFVEILRTDDDPLRSGGHLLSLSQWLCLPMFLGGLLLILRSSKGQKHS